MSAFNDHMDELRAQDHLDDLTKLNARIAQLEAENAQLKSSSFNSIFGVDAEQQALRKLDCDVASVGQNAYITPALQADIEARLAEVCNRTGMTVGIAQILVNALGDIHMEMKA